MADERSRRAAAGIVTAAHGFMNAQLWLLCAVFFLNSIVNYGLFLWMPKLLEDWTGAEGYALSAITAVPFVIALGAMIVVGRASDRTGHRQRYVAGCAIVTGVGLIVAVTFQHHAWVIVLGFTIAQMAIRSLAGVFWALPSQFLGGTAAAAGLALINAIGGIGGFVGPSLIGWIRDTTGGYTGGLLVFSGVLLLEAVLVLCVRTPRAIPR